MTLCTAQPSHCARQTTPSLCSPPEQQGSRGGEVWNAMHTLAGAAIESRSNTPQLMTEWCRDQRQQQPHRPAAAFSTPTHSMAMHRHTHTNTLSPPAIHAAHTLPPATKKELKCVCVCGMRLCRAGCTTYTVCELGRPHTPTQTHKTQQAMMHA